MEAPRSGFCKGCQGQAGKTLQGICRNGNKDIPSWFCSRKYSFPCTLTSKTSSTLKPGWKQQAKLTGVWEVSVSTPRDPTSARNHSLQTKPLSVHSLCSCPSLAFRDSFGTNCTKQTLFQTISHSWFSLLTFHSAFANIHASSQKVSWTEEFFIFPNTHCLNFLPKLVFFIVPRTQVSGKALSFKSTWLPKGAIKVNFSLYHTWSCKLRALNVSLVNHGRIK